MKQVNFGNRIVWITIAIQVIFCIGLCAFLVMDKKSVPEDQRKIEPVAPTPQAAVPQTPPVIAAANVNLPEPPEQGENFVLYEDAQDDHPGDTPVQQTPDPAAVASRNVSLPRKLVKPYIVVYKKRGVLELYSDGKLIKTYPASTGKNEGDKEKSGDKKTPEGKFYVCVRNHKSRYVLSLGLSYPSSSDAKRGLKDGLITQGQYDHIMSELRLKRQPPWNTKLGGSIMIHGKRNGGRTTAGCIAIEDEDIRELYPRIPLRTKVTVYP